MAKITLERKALVKEARYYINKFRPRYERITKRFEGGTPATKSFIESGGSFYTRGKTDDQLRDLIKNLRRVDNLTTSRMVGAKSYYDFTQTIDNISKFNKKTRDEIMGLWDKFVEEKNITDHFKYEVLSLIANYNSQGLSDDEIRKKIDNAYYKHIEQKAKRSKEILDIFEANEIL